MQSTAASAATAHPSFMDIDVTGTQPTRCYRLQVHVDRTPNGEADGLASVLYARRVTAAEDPETLVLYGDGSGRYQQHHEHHQQQQQRQHQQNHQQPPDMSGVGVAWRRRTEPLFHATGRRWARRMLSDELELWAVYVALCTAYEERWRGVESRVLVFSDHTDTIRAIRDWRPGRGGLNEEVLRYIKRIDDMLAAQGVSVVVRFLKGRMGIKGHDVADVYARTLSGAQPLAENRKGYRNEEALAILQLYAWQDAVNEDKELNREMTRFVAEVESQL